MTTEATKSAEESSDFDAEQLFNEITNDRKDFSTQENSDDVENSLGPVEDEEQDDAEQANQDDSQASPDDSDATEDDDKDTPDEERTEPEADPDDDIWAAASEAQRQAYLKLQHERLQLQNDVKANAGRVQGYAKKLNEVQAQLEELKKGGSQQQANAGQDIQLDGKTLQEIEDDYPEIAQFVRSQTQQVVQQFKQELDPIRHQTEQLSGGFQELSQERQQQVIRNELDRLANAHPDYVELRQAPDFHSWLNSKPESIRALANSMSADDNIELLNIYKAQRSPAPRPEAPAAVPTRKPDLSEHAEVPRKGAAPPKGLPEDPEELFKLITSQKKY